MERRAISTTNAPQAIGPYSQAIRCGDWLFLSGQIPLDPASGQILGTTIEAQTDRVMKNIVAVLREEGLNLGHVVKATVFLSNMDDFAKFNSVYEGFVQAPYPARSTVQVAKLPRGALVEIEMTAVGPGASR